MRAHDLVLVELIDLLDGSLVPGDSVRPFLGSASEGRHCVSEGSVICLVLG